MSDYLVVRAALIETRQEAIDYYAARIAGVHVVTFQDLSVEIHLERDGTHLYSEDAGDAEIAPSDRVVRRVSGGRVEVRRFSLQRARLLDEVVPAVAKFTVSIPGTGVRGAENRMLHGPRLPSGDYMRVVLRRGTRGAWVCISAYPVAQHVWLEARRSKSAKFPPDD